MKSIIVGTEECSIHDVWIILSKSQPIKEKWSGFAGYLRISYDDFEKLHRDLIVEKINRDDILKKILHIWVAEKGSEAKLIELIRVVEDDCRDDFVGEKLRLAHDLPCKNFQISSTNWETLSKAFQEKVETNISSFLPNIPIDRIKSNLKGQTLLDLMTGKKPQLFNSNIPQSPAFYLERTLYPRYTILEKIFDEDVPDIFVFVGLNEFELGQLIKKHETSTSGKQLDSSEIYARFLVLEQENHFKKICERANTPVHLFSYDTNCQKLKWLKTSGRINVLQRFVEDCQNPMTEEQLLETLENKDGPILISDSPGMGKTFLLANIALELEKVGKEIVMFISLNDFVKEVKVNFKFKTTKLDAIKDTLQNLICKNELGISDKNHAKISCRMIFREDHVGSCLLVT